jgi:hypothetical protein
MNLQIFTVLNGTFIWIQNLKSIKLLIMICMNKFPVLKLSKSFKKDETYPDYQSYFNSN